MLGSNRKIPRMGLGECLIGPEEETLVLEVLRSKSPFRYYSAARSPENPPPMAAALEKEASTLLERPYVLGVTSGTAALETALGALGIGPGDEVIVPCWSWISCFTAIVRIGAKPVLAEVDESLCLDPVEIARLTNERTKAVMVIHYQGVAAAMEPILEAAQDRGLKVIEDCAEAFGVRYKARRVGTYGDIGIYSFQNNKVVTAGEGGLVVTADPDLYERAVRMSDLGNYRPYHAAVKAPTGIGFAGANYRMNELVAAMGLAQIRKLDGMIERVRGLRARLMERIGSLQGLRFRKIPDNEGDIGFETYLYFDNSDISKRFSEVLRKLGVSSTKHTGTYCHYAKEYCQHGTAHSPAASPFQGMEPWPTTGYRKEDFPKTNRVIESMVALPIGALFDEDDIDYIAAAVAEATGAIRDVS